MNAMNEVYISGTGAFLPGDPVDNEQLAARFGADTPAVARLRSRTLAANGIRTRHYAVDDSGMTVMLNEELAAEAARRALADRGLDPRAVRMLATGTTQGDLLVPRVRVDGARPAWRRPDGGAVGRGGVRFRDGGAQGRGVRCPAGRTSGGRRGRL